MPVATFEFRMLSCSLDAAGHPVVASGLGSTQPSGVRLPA